MLKMPHCVSHKPKRRDIRTKNDYTNCGGCQMGSEMPVGCCCIYAANTRPEKVGFSKISMPCGEGIVQATAQQEH